MKKHKVLDLFCGIGGLSYGFAKDQNFSVLGVDNNEWVKETYPKHTKAQHLHANIGNFNNTVKQINKKLGKPKIILGGPPCKPFSTYNLTRRKSSHLDYKQLKNYFEYIKHYKPEIFILENVPALKASIGFQRLIKDNELNKNYYIQENFINYHDYGASTSRKRLFVVGLKDRHHFMENDIFDRLKTRQSKNNNNTLEKCIGFLKDKEKGSMPDHTWTDFKTIWKYYKFYKTEKYGWYILKWDKPSPSLGNLSKTYVLHPNIDRKISPIFDNIAKLSLEEENYRTKIPAEKLKNIVAQNNKKSEAEKDRIKRQTEKEIEKAQQCLQSEGRVLSVKELSLIMGFRQGFSFPKIVNGKNQEIEIPVNARYQMLVDSVSPKFSIALAATVKKIL